MICERCETEFDATDSIGSKHALCQDCGEQGCSRQWWMLVGSGEEPTEMIEHNPPRPDMPEGANLKDRIGRSKPPLHLIPPAAEILEAIVMGLGARKYQPYNWRSSKVRATVYLAAAKRHLAQWLDGSDNDAESGVSHLAHARACLGVLLDAQATGNMVDDRPLPGVATALIEQHTNQPQGIHKLGQ